MTTPLPRAQPRPRPTTAGPTRSATAVTASWKAEKTWFMARSLQVTCELQVTLSGPPRRCRTRLFAGEARPHDASRRRPRPGRRPLDPPARGRPSRRAQALQRAPGGTGEHRAERPQLAPEVPDRAGAARRRAVQRAAAPL